MEVVGQPTWADLSIASDGLGWRGGVGCLGWDKAERGSGLSQMFHHGTHGTLFPVNIGR